MSFIGNMVKKVKKSFHKMKSKFDKGGSYTGSPDDPGKEDPVKGEVPEQDADDL